MSSIGTGYDLAASTFSPDGRIFQVEYAQKAVDNMGTVLAIRCKDGIVTAVDKVVNSKLEVSDANPRISNVTDHIGFTSAGVYPDCRSLLDFVQNEALKYLKEFRQPVPIKKLASNLAEYVHIFTLGISRPYGASIFLTAYDPVTGPHVYLIEPSGLFYEYKAWAVGKHRQAAKTEIEKLKLDELSIDQLVKETVRILITIRDEAKDKNLRVEMGWVGKHTNGKHELVPADKIAEAEQWAKSKLDEEDMEE
ncbi:Proteasome subunit alpha type-3 [Aphelenchoides besseyi]|nr:Proteasome subunit alpha type-3 [Aphelenchoides besseyi]KAI6211576.1 Proteasome subunit alpha type-3 [Aphelenchoides besseyi]